MGHCCGERRGLGVAPSRVVRFRRAVRAVIQRVKWAKVEVGAETVGAIQHGSCVLVGVENGDSSNDAEWLAAKVVGARIFEDDQGKMNRSLLDVGGELLAISQFTLCGDLRSGKRPSFSAAAEPSIAEALFEQFCRACVAAGIHVERGRFRAHMEVSLQNSGPVTLLLDSKKTF
jgi:D-tyrosyl-tRNA(Tyr) deacylase